MTDQQDSNRFIADIHAQLFAKLIMTAAVQGHGGGGNDLDPVAQGSGGNVHVLRGKTAAERRVTNGSHAYLIGKSGKM